MLIPGTQEKLNAKNFLILLSLGITYFLAAKLGLSLAFLHPSATPIWAPTGIALAAFLIWGSKVWPAIFIGALFVNLITAGNIATSIGIAAGNTLEGVIGAFLVKRFIGEKDTFSKPVNIFKFLALAILATAVSATFGVTSLYLGGFVPKLEYLSVWTTWWLGDMGGALVVAPLILLWKDEFKISWGFTRLAEAIAAFLILVLTGLLLFGGLLPQSFAGYTPAFFFLPVIVWVAFRFGPRETATGIFILFAVATVGTLKGTGPFVGQNPNQSLLAIQLFIGTIFLSIMPLAAAAKQERLVERMLRESGDRYRKLIETSPDAILVSDLAGNIQMVNKHTLALYGLKNRTEIVGRSGFDFVAPEDLPKLKLALGAVVKKGRISGVEYISLRKDGKRFYSSANASVLSDSEGNPESIIVVSHDISQKKEVEKMKSEFVSLASHQLRTPLGSMRWTTEMLLKGDYGELALPIKEVLKDLYDSLLRLIQLVNDLLDVSRIEEAKVVDNPEKADVGKIVRGVIHNIIPLTEKRHIKVFLKEPEEAIEIEIDKGKLADVIQNLLSNAIKYSKPEGRVDISLEMSNKSVRVIFSDYGIGIPDKDRSKVFSKFYRSEEASGVDSEGTGLGLFIVKTYVDNWGGKVYYESKLGKGTKFTVEIPLKIKKES